MLFTTFVDLDWHHFITLLPCLHAHCATTPAVVADAAPPGSLSETAVEDLGTERIDLATIFVRLLHNFQLDVLVQLPAFEALVGRCAALTSTVLDAAAAASMLRMTVTKWNEQITFLEPKTIGRQHERICACRRR